MKVPGNMKPLPMAEGTRKSRYIQSARPLVIKRRPVVPVRISIEPAIKGDLRCRV